MLNQIKGRESYLRYFASGLINPFSANFVLPDTRMLPSDSVLRKHPRIWKNKTCLKWIYQGPLAQIRNMLFRNIG